MSSSTQGPRDDRDSMLDLPLRGGGAQADLPFGPDTLRTEPVARPRQPTRRRPPRRPGSRRTWMAGLVLLAVVVLGGYLLFWPKPPRAGFSADPFVVGKVRVGVAGPPESLTVTNVGERPMVIGMLGLSGEQRDDFTLVEDTCGATTLAPQQSCEVSIQLAPTAMGQRQAVLELHAEMPDSPARLTVGGEGVAPRLKVAPPEASFGPQDVGTLAQAIDLLVVNDGTADLEIERVAVGGNADADFRMTRNDCSKSTLAPAGDCRLSVAFEPRAAGDREAELIITSDALAPVPTVVLRGEGIWSGAAFQVEPRSVDFGSQLVGTGRRSQRLRVVNRQAESLRDIKVSLVDRNQGFTVGENSCSGIALAPGSSCGIEIRFEARAEGPFKSLLEIGHPRVGTLGIDLQARGVAPRWVLAATTHDFGAVRVGRETESVVMELRNEGSAAAKVTKVEVEGPDAGVFRVGSDRCSGRDVAPGAGCTVGVSFAPRREGPHRATVVLRVEAGEGPQSVELQATAIAPRLSLDRELVDFDRVHRTTRRQVELTVTNSGTAPLHLGKVDIEGASAAEFQLLGGSCSGRSDLPEGGRCSLVVGFTPSVEGRATATLVIEHDGISGPRALPLAGVGLPPPIPEIVVETGRVDFGMQPIGNRSPIETVRLRAAGTGNLDLQGFSISGDNAADFVIVPATCQAAPSLQPGTDCTIGVRFVPTAGGRRSALLVVRHNAGSGSSTVQLTGEGLGAPPG